MARTKGAKNKPKVTLTKQGESFVINVRMEKQVEGAPVCRKSGYKWIKWGNRNDYPLQLSNLYYNSPTHHACCDFKAKAVLGDGVDYEAMQVDSTEIMPNYQYTWDELVYNLALDKAIYGCYALQVIKNKDGRTYSFYHQPMSNVRCAEKDEDGVITSYFISSDWTSWSQHKPVELERFGFQEDDEIKSGKAYLFVSEDYSPDIEYYSVPSYISSLKSIQAEVELERYNLRSVLNNFSASGILTLNRIDNEDERKAIIDNITTMFTGSDNANSIIINFKNNDEEHPTTFVKIDKDAGNNVNLFSDMDGRLVSKILVSHGIPNKALIGYDVEGASLGGDGNVLNVSYNLYNKTTGNKLRNSIVNTINKALAMNGIETQLILKPLTFNIATTDDGTTNNTSTANESGDSTAEQATDANNNNTNVNE